MNADYTKNYIVADGNHLDFYLFSLSYLFDGFCENHEHINGRDISIIYRDHYRRIQLSLSTFEFLELTHI